MRVAIIGAGPNGLKLAIELTEKKHIREIEIYDARAGCYTRPGVLDDRIFTKAGFARPEGKKLHIKDYENQLYLRAKALGILIHKHDFLGLYPDVKNPGICVDVNGNSVKIPFDLVFDCTGTARKVIHSVNTLDAHSPMKLKTISNVLVPRHFIAFGNMSFDHRTKLETMIAEYEDMENIPTMVYAESIVELQSLGWKHFTIPFLIMHDFEKDKVCLYLYAPDKLEKKDYDAWLEAVLRAYAPEVRFRKIPPPPPGATKPHKPRFGAFNLGGETLEQVAYKGSNLPFVVAKGDSEIDFNYLLGHGINDGLERIFLALDSIDVVDGTMTNFHLENYLQTMRESLAFHILELQDKAVFDQQVFDLALAKAKYKLSEALILNTHESVFTESGVKFIFDVLGTIPNYTSLDDLNLHVDLLKYYAREKQWREVSCYGKKALNIYESLVVDDMEKYVWSAKILSILIDSMCEQAKLLLSKERSEAHNCYLKASELFQNFKANLHVIDNFRIEAPIKRLRTSFENQSFQNLVKLGHFGEYVQVNEKETLDDDAAQTPSVNSNTR